VGWERQGQGSKRMGKSMRREFLPDCQTERWKP
jgi:hypothetical protein